MFQTAVVENLPTGRRHLEADRPEDQIAGGVSASLWALRSGPVPFGA